MDWEHITGPPYGRRTHRLPVPGGWVYRVETQDHSDSTCFVPAPPNIDLCPKCSCPGAWAPRQANNGVPVFYCVQCDESE